MSAGRPFKYMHTLDGRPAFFVKQDATGGQICFSYLGKYSRPAVPLVDSLAQIRREQQATLRWRREQGLTVRELSDYSYVRVAVPKHPHPAKRPPKPAASRKRGRASNG